MVHAGSYSSEDDMTHEYTEDWFTRHIPVFKDVTDKLEKRNNFLEVGSFEGRSACWLLENVLSETGSLTCIDNWYGVKEHNSDGALAEKLFDKNIELSKKPNQWVYKLSGNSPEKLGELIKSGDKYDFIYVDGHHSSPMVLSDVVMSFWLLKIGGIMHMDDYGWDFYAGSSTQHPKPAIDAFVSCFAEYIEVIYVGYQYAIRRIK
jgi:predicted O-methyltransferase YrrM